MTSIGNVTSSTDVDRDAQMLEAMQNPDVLGFLTRMKDELLPIAGDVGTFKRVIGNPNLSQLNPNLSQTNPSQLNPTLSQGVLHARAPQIF
jgi:hypothetical protein